MRVLFATGSPARYMLPPQLGDEQIVCGPDWPDETAPDGRVRSLATPIGEYDLAAVAARLPAEQQPDVVVCLVDAAWRNLPGNLAALSCPRVLLVADTHHLGSPILGMFRYLMAQPFDRIVFLYDRHHVPLFHSAGFRNLYWFPGLTLPHGDIAVRKARVAGARASRIAFVGQAGKHHPRRARLLDALTQRGLPIAAKALSQADSLGHYGASLLGFNASLNGDLNLRVFEILASGAALLTDRLAPESGLTQLLGDGREMITYSSAAELAERAADAIAHPRDTRAIGAAGAAWFDAHFNAARRRVAFQSLAVDGTAVPEFELNAGDTTRVFFSGDTDRLVQSILVYEGIQELHRNQETVRLAIAPEASADIREIFSSLPRVEFPAFGSGQPADMEIFGRDRAISGVVVTAPRIWCWDAQEPDYDALVSAFGPSGFELAGREVACLCRTPSVQPAKIKPAAASAQKAPASKARALFEQGDVAGAFNLAKAELEQQPRSIDARLLLGEILLQRPDGVASAEKLLRQAIDLGGDARLAGSLLAEALVNQGKLRAASEILQRLRRTAPQDLGVLLAMAGLHMAENNAAAAEAVLREAAAAHPDAAKAARRLGDLLKKTGRVAEALAWHRRSLGATEPALPPVQNRKKVLFVVQHGPFWPSLASVHAAFAADPAWDVTVVGLPYFHPYYTTDAERHAVFTFLKREEIAHVRWDQFTLQPGVADLVFLQNPYEVTRPAAWRTESLLRAVPRIAYVPYCVEGGNDATDHQNQFNQPLQQLAWAIFARDAEHRERFARHCATGNAHVIVTGHPKTDALQDLEQARDPELDAFAAGRKLVCWNPHFDVTPDGSDFGGGYSTFLRWHRFLPEEFARRKDLALVIRPHPLLFPTLTKRGVFTAAQVDDFLKRCAAAGVAIDRRSSYLPVFASSCAMLSDLSTFTLEYPVTGKPLLYLRNPHGSVIEDESWVAEFSSAAETEDAIRRFLDDVAAGHDPHAAARTAAHRARLRMTPGGVGPAIKRAIEQRLQQERAAEVELVASESTETATEAELAVTL